MHSIFNIIHNHKKPVALIFLPWYIIIHQCSTESDMYIGVDWVRPHNIIHIK